LGQKAIEGDCLGIHLDFVHDFGGVFATLESLLKSRQDARIIATTLVAIVLGPVVVFQ
jgi:hypothetical protein